MRGEYILPTKLLDKDEILQGKSLRTLSQKDLKALVNTTEKVGVMLADQEINTVMMTWKKYETLVDIINEKEEMIVTLSNILEDIEIASEYGESVLKAERKESKTYEVDTVEDLFKMIE